MHTKSIQCIMCLSSLFKFTLFCHKEICVCLCVWLIFAHFFWPFAGACACFERARAREREFCACGYDVCLRHNWRERYPWLCNQNNGWRRAVPETFQLKWCLSASFWFSYKVIFKNMHSVPFHNNDNNVFHSLLMISHFHVLHHCHRIPNHPPYCLDQELEHWRLIFRLRHQVKV